ncbi:MAG: hypothetical protein D6763_05575 [Alphaproteobacteria bacterium]|nr:MAG: hypothetical protein D6763_05575 [Alphaproteobacteria bacterium]
MCRTNLETWLRRLETGLDRFEGVQWIERVGDIARLRDVVLHMTPEAAARCAARIDHEEIVRIDRAIAVATQTDETDDRARAAFMDACESLERCLAPARPYGRAPHVQES